MLSWPASAPDPLVEPSRVYTPARLPVLVIVTEPVASSPILAAESAKTAPLPDRVIVSEPDVNALFEIVVGVAVKLAYVPPTAAIETVPTAAIVARTFQCLNIGSPLR